MDSYITQAGDVLDAICFDHYGAGDGVAEAILNSNPQLANYAIHLPAGVVITLPDLDMPTESASQVQLWD